MRPSKAYPKSETNSIFVGNIPPKTSKRDLKKYFSKFGEIQRITFKEKNGRFSQNSASIVYKHHASFKRLLGFPQRHSIKGFLVKVEKELRGRELVDVEADISKRRVYVKNIPFAASEEALTELIEENFGEIELCYICKDKRSPGSKTDYAFVTFYCPKAAESILKIGVLRFPKYQTKVVFRRFRQKGSNRGCNKHVKSGNLNKKKFAYKKNYERQGRKTSRLTIRNMPGLDFSFERDSEGANFLRFHSKVLTKITKNHGSFNLRFNR